MEKFEHDHKINQAPRHLLIGSYFREKICITTRLVKWYLEHSLVITKIYKVVKYTLVAAFIDFTVQVANARLQGDSNQRYALIAELTKLIGNVTYALPMNTKLEQKSRTTIIRIRAWFL